MLQYLSSAKKLQTLTFQELCSVDPRLLGPTQNFVGGGGGGGWKNEWNAFVRASLLLESRSRKAL